MRSTPLEARIEDAVEHILWCSQWQGDGFVPLRIMRDNGGKLAVVETGWFQNRERGLKRKLREFLGRWSGQSVTVLYSPVAFSKERALAVYAVESRLAYVDADAPHPSENVPEPTRIVASSARNGHWFWVLSAAVTPDRLQSINQALIRLVHGDKGGHSPARLFRLPGFPNLKYDPPSLVTVQKDTSALHDADRLIALAPPTGDGEHDHQEGLARAAIPRHQGDLVLGNDVEHTPWALRYRKPLPRRWING
jgi:hypothetical protein